MKVFSAYIEELDILIYRAFEKAFDILPEKGRHLWIFLSLALLLIAITLVDVQFDYKANLRPLLILPILLCAAFTNRTYCYALALLASLDWTEAFRIKIIPDGGAIHSFLNWSVAVFALLCVAEFSSLAVGTVRNLADYILSTESQTRELLESAVAPDEDEE